MTFICVLLVVVCILWMSLLVPGMVFSFELPLIVETDNILSKDYSKMNISLNVGRNLFFSHIVQSFYRQLKLYLMKIKYWLHA